jgi:hypothetical protein
VQWLPDGVTDYRTMRFFSGSNPIGYAAESAEYRKNNSTKSVHFVPDRTCLLDEKRTDQPFHLR